MAVPDASALKTKCGTDDPCHTHRNEALEPMRVELTTSCMPCKRSPN
jgi:hypothetical protein